MASIKFIARMCQCYYDLDAWVSKLCLVLKVSATGF